MPVHYREGRVDIQKEEKEKEKEDEDSETSEVGRECKWVSTYLKLFLI